MNVAEKSSGLPTMQCRKLLTLRWRSPLSSPSRHTNSHWVLNNFSSNPYSLFWQLVYGFYVLSFKSKIFETSQFLSQHYTRHLHDEWHLSMAFQRFRPAISHINIHALVLDIYNVTSSPFIIQFILLDFNDVRCAMFDLSTMRRRAEQSVM